MTANAGLGLIAINGARFAKLRALALCAQAKALRFTGITCSLQKAKTMKLEHSFISRQGHLVTSSHPLAKSEVCRFAVESFGYLLADGASGGLLWTEFCALILANNISEKAKALVAEILAE